MLVLSIVLSVVSSASADRPLLEVRSIHKQLQLVESGEPLETGWAWGKLPELVAASPRAKILATRAVTLNRWAWATGLVGGGLVASSALVAHDSHNVALPLSLTGSGVGLLLSTVFLASFGSDEIRRAIAVFNEDMAPTGWVG